MAYRIRFVRNSRVPVGDVEQILLENGVPKDVVSKMVVQNELDVKQGVNPRHWRTVTVAIVLESVPGSIGEEVELSKGISIWKPNDQNNKKQSRIIAFRRAVAGFSRKERKKLWEKYHAEFPVKRKVVEE